MDNKISANQLAAKKYIDEHKLEKITGDMLNSLVHDKDKHPIVYMIKFLAGLLSEDERRQNGLSIPEPYPSMRPIVKYPTLDNHDNLLKKFINKAIYSTYKYTKSKQGGSFSDLIKINEQTVYDKAGICFIDGDSLNTFEALVKPIIKELHNLKEERSEIFGLDYEEIDNDNNNELYLRTNYIRVNVSRNLFDCPYNTIVTKDKRESIETLIVKAIDSLRTDNLLKSGKYWSMSEDEEKINKLLNELTDFDMMNEYMKKADLKSGKILC